LTGLSKGEGLCAKCPPTDSAGRHTGQLDVAADIGPLFRENRVFANVPCSELDLTWITSCVKLSEPPDFHGFDDGDVRDFELGAAPLAQKLRGNLDLPELDGMASTRPFTSKPLFPPRFLIESSVSLRSRYTSVRE